MEWIVYEYNTFVFVRCSTLENMETKKKLQYILI